MTNKMRSNPDFQNERTSFGKMCKYLWIGFNIMFSLYVIYFILEVLYGFANGSYISGGEVDPSLGIGLIISVVVFVSIFLVGNIVLGLITLLTRPKKH